jgi:hypothetical protein
MRRVGELIVEAISNRDDVQARDRIAAEVRDMCARFPVPGLPAT